MVNTLDRVRRALAKYDDAVERAEQSRLALVLELRKHDMATGCGCGPWAAYKGGADFYAPHIMAKSWEALLDEIDAEEGDQ